MGISIHPLDRGNAAAWDRFVLDDCPEATFFHRAGWKQVIEDAFGQACPSLLAERDGRIVGVLPLVHVRSRLFGNRLISNGFTIGGGVAALDDEARLALEAEALGLMDKLGCLCLEVRRPARPHDGGGWTARSDVYANFSRPIAADEDACLKQIPRKQRAVVRKAIDAGLLTDEVDRHCRRFFPLYGLSMRDMGTPVFGRRFFGILMDVFAGACDCVTVLHDGLAVASVLNFYFRDRVMPYYTGCLHQARGLGANDYMYWRLMRRALERNYTTFDFGRSKVGTGPYSFKKNWGFEPEPIVQEYRLRDGEGEPPQINPLNPKYRMFIAVWRRLPLTMANRLGPLVVREIG